MKIKTQLLITILLTTHTSAQPHTTLTSAQLPPHPHLCTASHHLHLCTAPHHLHLCTAPSPPSPLHSLIPPSPLHSLTPPSPLHSSLTTHTTTYTLLPRPLTSAQLLHHPHHTTHTLLPLTSVQPLCRYVIHPCWHQGHRRQWEGVCPHPPPEHGSLHTQSNITVMYI